jgi:hypothetical protein
MFTPKTPIERTMVDVLIDNLIADMSRESPDSDEYAKMAAQLVKLYPLKDAERPKTISPDVLATVVANLAGIGVILWHERAGIITTKALSFVMKLR